MSQERRQEAPGTLRQSVGAVALAIGVVMAGCSVERLPASDPPPAPTLEQSPSPSIRPSSRPTASVDRASPTPTATPAPTPTPTPPTAWTPPPPGPARATPPPDLPLVTATEKDDVRVEIELERNPMPAGEWTGVRTRVTNLGGDALTWFTDGCATLVRVTGVHLDHEWRQGFWDFEGAVGEFEDHVIEYKLGNGEIRTNFVRRERIGRGSSGCADVGMSFLIAPGDTIERRRIWDGYASALLSPPPGGRVRLTGTFGYYWRGEEPTDITSRTISVELDAWIDPLPDAYVHPAEALDVALLDRRLTDVIAARDLFNANEPLIRFDPIARDWQVGLLDHHHDGTGTIHMVVVDGRTGVREAWIERQWVFDRDGFP